MIHDTKSAQISQKQDERNIYIYVIYIYIYIISINIYKQPSKFKIQVLSTSAKICRDDFRIFQFVLAIHW